MTVYNISDPMLPTEIMTLTPGDFGGLRPNHVSQKGNQLFVALGEFQGIRQLAGLAIVDISDPEDVMIKMQWESTAFNSGCPIALIDSNYAFLTAMENGVIILDITGPNEIKFVSQLTLDSLFPEVPNIFSEPHVRGIAHRNDFLIERIPRGSASRVSYRWS